MYEVYNWFCLRCDLLYVTLRAHTHMHNDVDIVRYNSTISVYLHVYCICFLALSYL